MLRVCQVLPSACHPTGGVALNVGCGQFFVSNGKDGATGGTGGVGGTGATGATGMTGMTGGTGAVLGVGTAGESDFGLTTLTVPPSTTAALAFSLPLIVPLDGTFVGGTYTAGESGAYAFFISLNVGASGAANVPFSYTLVQNGAPSFVFATQAYVPSNPTATFTVTSSNSGLIILAVGDTLSVSVTNASTTTPIIIENYSRFGLVLVDPAATSA